MLNFPNRRGLILVGLCLLIWPLLLSGFSPNPPDPPWERGSSPSDDEFWFALLVFIGICYILHEAN